MMRAYTVRDNRTFFSHYVPLINFQSHVFKRLQDHPSRGQVAIAAYLGFINSVESALDNAGRGESGVRLSAEQWVARESHYKSMGLSHDEISALKQVMGPSDHGLSALPDLTPAIVSVGERRPVIERAMLIASEYRPEHSLDSARADAEDRGHISAVARLTEARAQATSMGIDDIQVTWKFPIALAAFGYTRSLSDPEATTIHSFREPGRYQGKLPIFAVATETEAVVVTLSPVAVASWLASKGLVTAGIHDPVEAKTSILSCFADELMAPAPVAAIRTLVHSIAHCLLRSLGEGQVGFAESSLAEWIVPETLTIAIYANSLSTDTLGAFWTLINNRTLEWLVGSRESVFTCENDPLCHQRAPMACERCLYLAFGCRLFNDALSRTVLQEFWRDA